MLTPITIWSEYKDSNLGPSGPKPDALPDCATLRILFKFLALWICQARVARQTLLVDVRMPMA